MTISRFDNHAMTTLSLYTLSSQVEQLLNDPNAIDQETGELSAELVEALAMTKDKGVSVCAYILNQDSTLAAIEVHEAQVAARKAAIVAKQVKLRAYLADSMKRAGITEIKAHDGTFSAKLHIERDSAVEIFDEKQIPVEFMKTPKPPEPKPSKTEIAKAIKSGKEVPGAKLIKRDRLEIA
ncbi:siphovirus Gp157 family protein [Burkholderia gladioli]|uniref:siphovirus Gp157 family protein n=1 Tax=Burkholderia gladioli TaxID=28095 RepID=UPI0034DB547E